MFQTCTSTLISPFIGSAALRSVHGQLRAWASRKARTDFKDRSDYETLVCSRFALPELPIIDLGDKVSLTFHRADYHDENILSPLRIVAEQLSGSKGVSFKIHDSLDVRADDVESWGRLWMWCGWTEDQNGYFVKLFFFRSSEVETGHRTDYLKWILPILFPDGEVRIVESPEGPTLFLREPLYCWPPIGMRGVGRFPGPSLLIHGISSFEKACEPVRRWVRARPETVVDTATSLHLPLREYHKRRKQFNDIATAWEIGSVCKLVDDIDPFADTTGLSSDTPRWIPLIQWWRRAKGEEYNFLCAVRRDPDGLRLEITSNHPDKKRVLRDAREGTQLDDWREVTGDELRSLDARWEQ